MQDMSLRAVLDTQNAMRFPERKNPCAPWELGSICVRYWVTEHGSAPRIALGNETRPIGSGRPKTGSKGLLSPVHD